MNLDTFGGRRFLLTLGCGIATTVLQFFGKLDPAGSTYALVVIGTVGAYITGNTVQKVKAPNGANNRQLEVPELQPR